jgi:ABC-type branched-subunit amino acid transport system ATPase component
MPTKNCTLRRPSDDAATVGRACPLRHIHALHGVDIDVQVGEVVTLIGANGAGKSTLMMSIFGQPRASGGRIVFDGEDITSCRRMKSPAAASRWFPKAGASSRA